MEEKYESIRERSGVLTIMGTEYRAQLSDIVDIKELGRGSFGVVRKAHFKQTKTLMAVKVIYFNNLIFIPSFFMFYFFKKGKMKCSIVNIGFFVCYQKFINSNV